MNGCIELMDGWTGLIDRLNGWLDGWMNGCMDRWIMDEMKWLVQCVKCWKWRKDGWKTGCFNKGYINSNKKVELELQCFSIIFTISFLWLSSLRCTTERRHLLPLRASLSVAPVYLQTQVKSKECRALSLQLCDHYFPFSSNRDCQQKRKQQQQTSLTPWMSGGWKLQCHLVITDTLWSTSTLVSAKRKLRNCRTWIKTGQRHHVITDAEHKHDSGGETSLNPACTWGKVDDSKNKR